MGIVFRIGRCSVIDHIGTVAILSCVVLPRQTVCVSIDATALLSEGKGRYTVWLQNDIALSIELQLKLMGCRLIVDDPDPLVSSPSLDTGTLRGHGDLGYFIF